MVGKWLPFERAEDGGEGANSTFGLAGPPPLALPTVLLEAAKPRGGGEGDLRHKPIIEGTHREKCDPVAL